MSTMSQKKSEVTRALILQQALKLFQERGFEETTMRGIAEAASLSLGAAYYYFSSKESLVLHYYAESAREVEEHLPEILAESQKFADRFRAMLQFRHEQLKPVRSFIGVLVRQAGELRHPLSPFSAETRDLREGAIEQIEQLTAGSDLKVGKALRPHVAKMFWLFQLGIILFWINDASKEQARTDRLINLSLDLVLGLLQLTTLPMTKRLNRLAIQLVNLVESCTMPDEKEAIDHA